MKNVFDLNDVNEILTRLDGLSSNSKRLWGTMSVGQMLAHCNVTYEYVYEKKHAEPNFLMKFILKWLVKPTVVGDKPYKQNTRTAPDFIMTEEKDFEVEKGRLVDYIKKTQALGEAHFDNKSSHSFGKLTKEEWNTMFFKHLDHHFRQFGV